MKTQNPFTFQFHDGTNERTLEKVKEKWDAEFQFHDGTNESHP